MDISETAKLKELIGTSPLLGDTERKEWLALLPSMNEKQLDELFEILSPVQQVKSQLAPFHKPRLSHITNLPQGLVAKKSTQNKAGEQFKKHLNEVLREKELPPAPPEALLSSHQNRPQQKAVPPLSERSAHQLVKPQAHREAKPLQQQVAKETPKSQPPNLQALKLPASVADLALMQPGIIRAFTVSEVIKVVQDIVKRTGYFEALVQFEQSPLYKLYLYTGSRLLEQNIEFTKLAEQLQLEHRDYFTRGEFEYVLDVLKSMQINT